MAESHRRDIDRAILEFLKESGMATPALIAKKINRNRRYVANRFSYLVKEGLVEKISRGVYRLRVGVI